MAKLMSKKTREIVQVVAVLVIIALFLTFYLIYPLVVVPRFAARPDREKFKTASFRPANDPAFYIQKGYLPDTFSVVSNDNIALAVLYFRPDTASMKSRGTVILLHADNADRTSLLDYVQILHDSGWAVTIFDQRAHGATAGRYSYAGNYEADDLSEVIAQMNLFGTLRLPLIVVGFQLGGDAAINAARSERRISSVIAVDPYLTSTRWLDQKRRSYGALTIPFSNMIYFWWYQKLSSYPTDRTGVDDIQPVGSETTILAGNSLNGSKELARLKEKSDSNLLKIEPTPGNSGELVNKIISLVSASDAPK